MSMPRKYPKGYYTYVFYNSDNIPVWVGAGKGNRACERRCREYGGVRIEIIEAVSKEKAFELESLLINRYGRLDLGLGTLLNLTDGLGSSGAWSVERRIKASSSAIGHRNWTEERRQKHSIRLLGNKRRLGIPHTKETKQLILSKVKGRKLELTDEERRRRADRIRLRNITSPPRKGKTYSNDHCT